MNLRVLALILLLVFVRSAQASESVELAKKGDAAWSAFSCAALASHLEKHDEQRRLFDFGYRQGLEFIAAMQAGKIKREDLSVGVPVGVLFALQGPTPDFMLGRMYESVTSDTLGKIYKSGDYFRTESEQAIAASTEFSDSNCELLGGAR